MNNLSFNYETSKLGKWATFAIISNTILIAYGWKIGSSNLSFGFILNFILSACFFIKGAQKQKAIDGDFLLMPKPLLCYMLWLLITKILVADSITDFFPISVIGNIMALCLFFNVIKYDYLVYMYRRIAIFVVLFFFYQFIINVYTGSFPSGQVPFFPSLFKESTDSIRSITDQSRCYTFFLEPSHMGVWLLPLLCIELFEKSPKIMRVAVISLILLLLRSGCGILGLGAIAVSYILHMLFARISLKRKILTIGLIIISSFILSVYLNSESGKNILNRSTALEDSGDNDPSSYVRIFRGYLLIDDLSPTELFFGCNSNDKIEAHARSINGYCTIAGDDVLLNGVQDTIVRTGIIGVLLMLIFILYLWHNNNNMGKTLIVTWITISFVHINFMEGNTFLFWILIFLCKQRAQKQKILIHP